MLKKIMVVCAAVLGIGFLAQTPARAVQQSAFVFVTPRFVTSGGTINCSSGCTITDLGGGYTQIDLGSGESILSLPDGSLVGTP